MLKNLMVAKKTIVCIGSGGVGKTTVSAAIGLKAAQAGLKTLVLTVDPAKRLATTLGIEPGSDIHRVNLGDDKLHLYASIIDARKVFDDFVTRAATQGARVERLLQNHLYQQLTTTLSGSQEFTALEKLMQCYESNDFDLIVLDTPPTKHAIDFLNAPQKIAALFDSSITKWLKNPEGQGLFSAFVKTGTQKVLEALQKLTGSDFIGQLRDFFANIEGWQGELETRTLDVHRLLVSPDTHFVLVTSFDEAKVKEAEYFAREINRNGYHLSNMIINRSYPEWLPRKIELESGTEVEMKLAAFAREMNQFFNEKWGFYQSVRNLWRDLEPYLLPEHEADISDLKGLQSLVEDINNWETANDK